MISIIEISKDNSNLICNISGLTDVLDYRTCLITNGENIIKLADLAGIFSSLIHLDDITVKDNLNEYVFYKKNYTYALTNEEIKEFKWKPFAHQIEAINYCLYRNSSLLLDSMGLG